jgi:hypothetical protein
MSGLRRTASTFPSQDGVRIGPWLERYAGMVLEGLAIVEIGCWLGAGTAYLALGAMQSGAPIHTYDRWTVSADEKVKAGHFGMRIAVGDDTLARVQRMLSSFPVAIEYHQGDIRKAKWDGKPIGLYVDDATKVAPIWSHAMNTFKPSFVPENTHLILMDYHFDEKAGPKYAAQKRYMAEHKQEFELIEDRLGGSHAAVFRYIG